MTIKEKIDEAFTSMVFNTKRFDSWLSVQTSEQIHPVSIEDILKYAEIKGWPNIHLGADFYDYQIVKDRYAVGDDPELAQKRIPTIYPLFFLSRGEDEKKVRTFDLMKPDREEFLKYADQVRQESEQRGLNYDFSHASLDWVLKRSMRVRTPEMTDEMYEEYLGR